MILRIICPDSFIEARSSGDHKRSSLIKAFENSGLKYGLDFKISNTEAAGHDRVQSHQHNWNRDGSLQYLTNYTQDPIMVYFDPQHLLVTELESIISNWMVRCDSAKTEVFFIPCKISTFFI